MSDRTGQHLGNYRLLRLLGKGGFAEVYLGEHIHLVTEAAIKVLLAHLDSQTDVADFRREAQTIARLTHPHIVRVLDFDVEQGVPFLVMEYASFGSLRTRHPRGQPLPLSLILSYVQQVASALQHAHGQRLIHRDVKPDNMLLRDEGTVVLSDFGIVTIAHSTSSRGIEAMAGTAAYMPPEQMQGEPRPASDQYALAVTVYEWITGQLPFRGTAIEIAMQHAMKPPPSLVEQVPLLPRNVEQVVLTALAKDPKERFATVQAFATALSLAVQSGQDVSTFIKPGGAPKEATPRESTPKAAGSSPTEPGTVAAPSIKPRPTRESRTTPSPLETRSPTTTSSSRRDSSGKSSGKTPSPPSKDAQIAASLSSFSDILALPHTAQQQILLELKDLLQRAKSQSLTGAEKFGLITSGVVTTAIVFIVLLLLAAALAPMLGINLNPSAGPIYGPIQRVVGIVLINLSIAIGFIPYSRGKQSVKDRYVKTITQSRFDTTKELEAEIERLQKQIGNRP